MKFRSRSEIINKIPNKYDAVMAISNRVKMLVEGKKRLVEEYDKENITNRRRLASRLGKVYYLHSDQRLPAGL